MLITVAENKKMLVRGITVISTMFGGSVTSASVTCMEVDDTTLVKAADEAVSALSILEVDDTTMAKAADETVSALSILEVDDTTLAKAADEAVSALSILHVQITVPCIYYNKTCYVYIQGPGLISTTSHC